MTITPYGAAGGEVTGSCYMIEANGARLMLDCGMFQGGRKTEARNGYPGGAEARLPDKVLVTHAHLDHVGRLPLLAQRGYAGPMLATPATMELAGLVLRDSAKVQAFDALHRNRKLERAGKPAPAALYTGEEVERVLKLLRPAPYHEPVEVGPGVKAIWVEAGHILGSASIELLVQEGGREKRVVFSGDLGPSHPPIVREAEPFRTADAVVLESTYGDRDHRSFHDTVEEFVGIVQEAARAKGRMIVPTFAIGRAQVLTLLLAWMFRERKVEAMPVFLDSPMAIEAGDILNRHPELYAEAMRKFLQDGDIRENLLTMRATATPEESQQINNVPGPCFIMAGAGMCNAGRIMHHLRHNLWRPEAHVIIVGFQSAGSLGRQLVDGEKRVRIFGEVIQVKAKVHSLGGFSAHAGQMDLLKWFAAVAPVKPRVILTHGEDAARTALAGKIREGYGLEAELPGLGERVEV